MLDNLSAHKTKDVERFLAEHSQVRFHFTPDLFVLAQLGRTLVRQDPTGMSSAAACLPPWPISERNSAVTFVSIPNQQSRSVGLTQTRPAGSALTKSPGQIGMRRLATLIQR